jgi:hypothetical protein
MDLTRFTRFDWYSMASVPIEMFFDQQPLSMGTAFFWEEGDRVYLVTAWHCLSGKHYQTKKHLSKFAGEPDRIKIWWNIDGQPVGRKGPTVVPIMESEGSPIWLVDPERGSDVDVAVLPITLPSNAIAYPINKLPEANLGMAVGQDVFIIGFPLGVGEVGLPIWKRGSLASEWQMPDSVQPYMLIDTASRPGMSGAPVIQRAYPYEPELAGGLDYGHNGKSRFLGLYSGRLANEGEADVQLGLMWSSLYIERIINGQRRDGEAPVVWPPTNPDVA